MIGYQTLSIELVGPESTPAAAAKLSSSVRWRDESDARTLVVNVLVRHAAAVREVRHLVQQVDATAATHRDRPILRVYCLPRDDLHQLIAVLAETDTRTPRIEVVRVLDHPLEPRRLAQLTREAAAAEDALLQFWAYLALPSASELVELAGLLRDDHRMFRRFPIVEVPGPFTMADADPIAAFWRRYPQMQQASARSLNGRVATFFELFEYARLTRLGLMLAHDVDDGLSSAYHRWLDGNNLLATEPRLDTGVLEHDVDLLSDSHECQSPVFAFAGIAAPEDSR
jgi:hypothetical protein